MDTYDYIQTVPDGQKMLDVAEAGMETAVDDLRYLLSVAEIRHEVDDPSCYCPECNTWYHASEYRNGCPVCGR